MGFETRRSRSARARPSERARAHRWATGSRFFRAGREPKTNSPLDNRGRGGTRHLCIRAFGCSARGLQFALGHEPELELLLCSKASLTRLLTSRLRGANRRCGFVQLRTGLVHGGFRRLRVDDREQLASLDVVVEVGVKLDDFARHLGADLDGLQAAQGSGGGDRDLNVRTTDFGRNPFWGLGRALRRHATKSAPIPISTSNHMLLRTIRPRRVGSAEARSATSFGSGKASRPGSGVGGGTEVTSGFMRCPALERKARKRPRRGLGGWNWIARPSAGSFSWIIHLSSVDLHWTLIWAHCAFNRLGAKTA